MEPKPKGPEGGEKGGENLQELRDQLKSFFSVSSDEAKAVVAKNEKFKDISADKIDDLSDEDLKELNKAVEEYLKRVEALLINQHVDKLMGLSFQAFFSVIERYEKDHPDAPKLKGYSRKSVEEFVRANLDKPGAEGLQNITEFEERLDEQQKTIDQNKARRGAGDPKPGDAPKSDGAPKPDDVLKPAGDTDSEPSDFESKKRAKVKEMIDTLFGGADTVRPGVFIETDGVVAFDDPANSYDRKKAEKRLFERSLISAKEGNLEKKAQQELDKLMKRKDLIEDMNARFKVDEIKKVLENKGKTYTGMEIPELEKLIQDLEDDKNGGEKKEKRKKRKRGRCVLHAIGAVGLAAATVLSMVALFGGGRRQAAVKSAPTEITMSTDELGITDPTEEDTQEADDEAIVDSEDAESQEGIWDAAHGNDARGLWASMDGEDANPDKDGSHDLVAAAEFADFLQDGKLDTEEGQREFKDHLVDVATREGVIMEQIADYAQKHGDLDFLPASIRNLEGEELEDAIKENRDGCYDALVAALREKSATGDVSVDHLQAGTYNNYYAHLTNPDAPATIDNLELENCQTWENGTPVFKITFDDGSTWLMKGKCIQLVELIPTNETVTTTAPVVTTAPGETTTTTTTTTTMPVETTTTMPVETTTTMPVETTTTMPVETTTTMPVETTTTMPVETTTPVTTTTETTTTTTSDNSKHEEALTAGQGTDVAPVGEGYQIAEDTSQDPYVYDFTLPVNPDALNADQTFIEYNFADEAQEQAAVQKAAATQEQRKIDEMSSTQKNEVVDIDKLGESGV